VGDASAPGVEVEVVDAIAALTSGVIQGGSVTRDHVRRLASLGAALPQSGPVAVEFCFALGQLATGPSKGLAGPELVEVALGALRVHPSSKVRWTCAVGGGLACQCAGGGGGEGWGRGGGGGGAGSCVCM
jgi:hypothetical protein